MKEMRLTSLSRIDKKYPIELVTSLLETALNASVSEVTNHHLTITTGDSKKINQERDTKIEDVLIARAIYEKVVIDAEYRRDLIGYIVSEGIIVARGAHREKDLDKEITEKLFNAKINEVLNPYYIRLLALRFEKTRGKDEKKKHSR